jgi:hypothetical protein
VFYQGEQRRCLPLTSNDGHFDNDSSRVSEEIEQQALAAVAAHPLQKEALGWPYCESDVFEQPKRFIDRMRLP